MLSRLLRPAPLLLLLMTTSNVAWAQDDGEEEEAPAPEASTDRQRPPQINSTTSANVQLDFVDTPLTDIIKYFAEITGRNFILTDDLKGEVTIISHRPVSVPAAYEAFLSALEVEGYTTVTVGSMTKVVPSGDAAHNNVPVYQNGNIPYTDNFVTQIIQLENVSVGDISSVVKDLGGKSAKIIAYAPTNTLIITDSAVN
ncbi:MAG: general secretion pathway protein D, partial [Myxococcota bacterium]